MSDPKRPRLRALETFPHEEAEQRGLLLVDPEGLFEDQVFVPEGLLPVVARFSGEQSLEEIARDLSEQYQQDVGPEFVERIANELEAKLCIEGPRVDAARAAHLASYRELPARPPTSAGSAGYPENADACRARLDAILGEGEARRPLRALVAPHIDLQRGELGYRRAYAALLGSEPATLAVLFGTGHRAAEHPLVPTRKDYATPVGTCPVDLGFVDRIGEALDPAVWQDEIRHLREHSVEFQALFLSHVWPQGDWKIAPFLTGHCSDAPGSAELGAALDALAEAIRAIGTERVLLVAGADLAHLGPFFGDLAPVSDEQLQQLEEQDRASLAAYAAGDFDGFWRDVEADDNPRRICGTLPMFCVGKLRERLGLETRSELLHYGQALAPDRSQVVSFASLAFSE